MRSIGSGRGEKKGEGEKLFWESAGFGEKKVASLAQERARGRNDSCQLRMDGHAQDDEEGKKHEPKKGNVEGHLRLLEVDEADRLP